MAEHLRLGEVLVNTGLINNEQVEQALKMQESDPGHRKLGSILLGLGIITEEHLCRALAEQMELEVIDCSITAPEKAAIDVVPAQWAIRHSAIPIHIEGDTIQIATSDPTNRWLVEDISGVTDLKIELKVTTEADVRVQLRRHYEDKDQNADGAPDGEDSRSVQFWQAGAGTGAMNPDGSVASDSGAVPMVNKIISEGIKRETSDISLLPQEEGLLVRYRIDGVFQDIAVVPVIYQAAVVSRIKILSNLDVTEHRRPQDGRARFEVGDQEVDVRIAIVPTMYGESIVLRLLDRMDGLPKLDTLGFRPQQFEGILEHTRRPQGLILMTGPTGSGKTTTIYGVLNEIYTPGLNIMTLEDPVEYEMKHVSQVQINEKSGFTFAQGLRSFLRAAPNVILVGEIRDFETAELAFQAGLTGHLVLSTLHTNDAVSTVMRLISMGVEKFLIASTLSLVVAQRLIRKVCQDCKRTLRPSPSVLRLVGITEEQAAQHEFYGGTGCEKCDGTGYKGRLGIYEILPMTDELKEIILTGGNDQDLRRAAKDAGVKTLRQEALMRAFQGLTTLEEVVRVTDVSVMNDSDCPRCGLPLPGPGQPCLKCAVFVKKTAEQEAAAEAAGDTAPAPAAPAIEPAAAPPPGAPPEPPAQPVGAPGVPGQPPQDPYQQPYPYPPPPPGMPPQPQYPYQQPQPYPYPYGYPPQPYPYPPAPPGQQPPAQAPVPPPQQAPQAPATSPEVPPAAQPTAQPPQQPKPKE